MDTVNKLFGNSYWRVCAEYLTLELAENVSDAAPVGQWIPSLMGGDDYAYFQSKDFAKQTLQGVIKRRIRELEYKLKELDNE